MVVRPGFKQTEVGVIPEDWRVAQFQALATIERGKFTARPRNDPRYYGGVIPFLQTGDVKNSGGLIRTYSQTLNSEGLKVSKLFPKGTLFFTIAANIADVGRAIFDAACPDSLVAITPISGVHRDWLAHDLRSRKSSFENIATHNAQLNINLEKLRPYLLPVPTPLEQKAIAAALSDADALIESLERLLAKKRDIKQGVLQELLTGKRRLRGFSTEWGTKSLASLIASLNAGISVNSVEDNRGPNVEGASILKTSSVVAGRFIPEERKMIVPRDVPRAKLTARKNSIIISRMNTPALVGECGYVDRDWPNLFLPDRLWMTVHSRAVPHSVRWLAYLLSYPSFNRLIKETATGTSGSMKNISKGSLLSIEVPFPEIAEQTAIATVLSDLDVEIDALEAKLAKVRQLKHGMMQELLTGRIRLV